MGVRINPKTMHWEPWIPNVFRDCHFDQFKSYHWVAFKKCFTIYLMATLVLITPCFALTGEELDALVPTIIQAESSGDPGALGDHGNSRGLMQISKATWERLTDEPWDDAFRADLNVQVGRKLLEEINNAYLKRGINADKAHICFSYNTGRYAWGSLPAWTKKHPNKIYRRIFNE